MESWQELENNVYFKDGSLRDIYVFNTDIEDWQKWANFVNENYRVLFNNYAYGETKNQIDFKEVINYWDGIQEECLDASVFLDTTEVKTFFFDVSFIENDITPKDIRSINDHHNLMLYMKGLSKTLNKEVVLTAENSPEIVLIRVVSDEITIL